MRWIASVALAAVFTTVLPPASSVAAIAPTIVSLTFDDGNADQAAAAASMRTAGLAGTFYITDSWIGAPGYLTGAQLSEMNAAGHEIGGHTVTHPDLIDIDLAEASRQICNNRATLQGWGYRPVSFAYPFSDSNAAVAGALRSCGYATGRGLGDTRSPYSCSGCRRAETLPPADPTYLRAPDQVDSRWTLSQLKGQVTAAANNGGGWVILTFHHVCAPLGTATCQADQSISPVIFNQFVTWLAAYRANPVNQTTVKTVDQVVRQYQGSAYPPYVPAARFPAPAEAAPGVNALHNPSLETPNPLIGLPTCFQAGGWGANSPVFTAATPGATGATAQRLMVSAYRNGDAKLLPTLDLGACSPTVTPGRTYVLSTAARSTAVTQYALYYRDAHDLWFYWTSSPWIAPMPGWTIATYETPPVPSAAVAISFGLALIANGELVTDDYGLTQSAAASSLQNRSDATVATTPLVTGPPGPTASKATRVAPVTTAPLVAKATGQTRGQQVVIGEPVKAVRR